MVGPSARACYAGGPRGTGVHVAVTLRLELFRACVREPGRPEAASSTRKPCCTLKFIKDLQRHVAAPERDPGAACLIAPWFAVPPTRESPVVTGSVFAR